MRLTCNEDIGSSILSGGTNNMYTCLFCNIECKTSKQKLNKYCSNKCQLDFQSKEKLQNWLTTGKIETTSAPPWLKRYILDKQNGKCFECGISEWRNKPLVLELEHKDGNSENNLEENLCCLCPNCHSQTPTYKAKNKGNGRSFRRKQNGNSSY
jgi:hypothetical protein